MVATVTLIIIIVIIIIIVKNDVYLVVTVILICMSGSAPGLYLLFIPWYKLVPVFFLSFEPFCPFLSLYSDVLSLQKSKRRKKKRREKIEIVVFHLITHHKFTK